MTRNPTRRDIAALAALAASAAVPSAVRAAAGAPGLAHDAEAIHQEIHFFTKRQRIYAALTTASQFDAIVRLGAAARSGKIEAVPAEIPTQAGGAFKIFGGFISGRNIELVADKRLVQAWREASWETGAYSLVRLELRDEDAGTRLIFDHTGFPRGAGSHLSIAGTTTTGCRWGDISTRHSLQQDRRVALVRRARVFAEAHGVGDAQRGGCCRDR